MACGDACVSRYCLFTHLDTSPCLSYGYSLDFHNQSSVWQNRLMIDYIIGLWADIVGNSSSASLCVILFHVYCQFVLMFLQDLKVSLTLGELTVWTPNASFLSGFHKFSDSWDCFYIDSLDCCYTVYWARLFVSFLGGNKLRVNIKLLLQLLRFNISCNLALF